jgi:hypothetical protein
MGGVCAPSRRGGGNDANAADVEHLANRPNKPLAANLPPYNSEQRMTTEKLIRERSDFWGSRVTGNGAVWSTLEQCAVLMLDHNDVDTANAILQASMLSTPNGDLSEVYDESGVCYDVPRYCFQNPVNLVDGLAAGDGGGGGGRVAAAEPAKFKAEQIDVKFRVGNGSETDDAKCVISTTDTADDLVQHFRKNSAKAAKAARIRLFFFGREVSGSDVCAAFGLRKAGYVILAALYDE